MTGYIMTKDMWDNLLTRITTIETTVAYLPALHVSIDRLLRVLDGNGQPGLIKEVNGQSLLLEQLTQRVDSSIAERKENTENTIIAIDKLKDGYSIDE